MKSAKHFLRKLALCLLPAALFALGSGSLQAQGQFIKINSLDELESGADYLMVYESSETAAMYADAYSSNKYTGAAATISNGVISFAEDALTFKFTKSEDVWTIYDNKQEKFIAYNSGTNFKTEAGTWTITKEDAGFQIGTNSRLILWSIDNSKFAPYAASNVSGPNATKYSLVNLYKKQAVTSCGKVSDAAVIAQQTTAMLSWTAAEPAPALGYVIEVTAGETKKNDTVKTTFLQLSELTAGTEYTYSITALCSAELAGEAVTGTFTTKAADAASVTATAPAEAAVFNDDVTFSWNVANFTLGDDKMVKLVINNGTKDTTLYSKEASIAVELGNGSYTATYSLVNVSGEGDSKTYTAVEGATDVRHFTVKDVLVKVANIAELMDGATNGYFKLTGEAVVSAMDTISYNASIWIQDATGGMLLYGPKTLLPKYGIGDAVANVNGQLVNYNGLLEVKFTENQPEAVSHNNKVDTTEVTLSQLTVANIKTYCSRLVRIKRLTLTTAAANDGKWTKAKADTAVDLDGNKIVIYPSISTGDFIGQPKTTDSFDLVCVVGINNGVVRVSPRYFSDIIRLLEAVADPVFNLEEDVVYTDAQQLTITSSTEGAEIHYTLDGTTPTKESTKYEAPITIARTQTVKAIAVKEGMGDSYVKTLTVQIAVKLEGEIVFEEYFDKFPSASNTNLSETMDDYTDNPGWTAVNAYSHTGGGVIRLGTAKAAGSVESPAIDLSANNGKYVVSFYAAAWNNDKDNIRLIAGGETMAVTGLTNTTQQNDNVTTLKHFAFEFDNGTEETKIKFEAGEAANNRFFLDSIRIYQVLPNEPMINVASTLTLATYQGMAVTQKLNVRGKLLAADVAVTYPEGNFSVTPATLPKEAVMGQGAELAVIYNGSKAADSVLLTLSSGNVTKTIKVKATAAPVVELEDLEALYESEQGVVYRIKGEVILTAKDSNYNYKWFQDEKAGIQIFDKNRLVTIQYEVGDGVTGICGKLSNNGGQLQLEPVGDFPAASSHDNKVEPEVVTIAGLNADVEKYCSRLVRINGLTLNNAEGEWAGNANDTATDGKDNIVIRTFVRYGNFVGEDKPEGKFDLVALAGVYNGTVQVSPRTKDDIMAVTDTTANRAMEQVVAGVYPNPTSGLVYVELTENVRMEIFTVSGAIVRTATLFAGKNEVVFNHSGIYFIRLSNATGTIVKRVVVR